LRFTQQAIVRIAKFEDYGAAVDIMCLFALE
jgi:hypothetical protein